MAPRFVEHRATAVWNSSLFSAGETELVLRRLSEFFAEEGLRSTQTSDYERWKISDEENRGESERGKVNEGCEEG